jgi:2-polyprenyl-3-methyl-5-hydroxy-6-metoxy-1,4-benzoquinol methylase
MTRMNEPETLNRETQEIWDQNAAFWDEYMGEGGVFQRKLIGPATERLLALKPGEHVLDIACGNGAFSRRLAQLGAGVVAFDFSSAFVDRAKARTTEHADRMDYRVIDATDEAQLLSLGQQQFDAAVCSVAMMDMVTIEPLMSALAQLLKPDARFVFSILHPCFNSGTGMRRVIEEEDRDGEIIDVYAVKISNYATPTTYKGLGVVGQPVPQYYFHRPLNVLFNTCFHAGFVLDALEEPVFDQNALPNRPFSWESFHEIPPVLIARLRLTK